MKSVCAELLSRITTARRTPISSNLERTPRRIIVKRGSFLALFAPSLLCACTGTPYGMAPVTERGTLQLVEQSSARPAAMDQSVLSWSDARTERIAVPAALEQARTIALASRRGAGLSGDWHGVLSQESSASDGSMVSLGRLFRVSLQQAGDTVTGSGEMSSGERLKISGTVEQGHSHGIVENVTYGIASRFVGTVTDQEIVVHFTNGGKKEGVQGVATLHRREN